jgi:hypothetical protein
LQQRKIEREEFESACRIKGNVNIDFSFDENRKIHKFKTTVSISIGNFDVISRKLLRILIESEEVCMKYDEFIGHFVNGSQ